MAWAYLWQNFLKDKKYIDFILSQVKKYISDNWYNIIFEIWPGKAAITKYLIELCDKIVLFEKDETFVEILNNTISDKWNIIWWDVLQASPELVINNLGLKIEEILIVWNLPYYITSPIFRKFFVELDIFRQWIFMIQKEVWEKIKIDAEKKSYLWWLLNYNYDVKYLKTVPAKAFSPAPKVDSCLVELKIKNEKLKIDFDRLIFLLDNISMYKRKTLWKIWKMCKDKNELFNFILPDELAGKRIEELGREEMERILSW